MDRDGTICEEVGYLSDVDRVRLLPRSAEALRKASEAGFMTVVVTNQSGVARGYFEEALVLEANRRMMQLLAAHGAKIDRIYYCPHHPTVGSDEYRKDCACRKPRPGMLLRARDELGIDLPRSYMVGDSARDVEAGRRAGATTVLVLTGYGEEEQRNRSSESTAGPDHVARDLLDAVDWILGRERVLADGERGGGAR